MTAAQIQLSIRSYSLRQAEHSHAHHQLVMPLHGNITLEINGEKQIIGPRRCAVIYQGELHRFAADECARFLVADLWQLPSDISRQHQHYLGLSAPFFAFIQYLEKQLQAPEFEILSPSICGMFWQLLSCESFVQPIDYRLSLALEVIEQRLSEQLSLQELASAAHLSLSQFKALFNQQLGTSPIKYITKLRMEKAKALLSYTDLPVNLVAERVGYTNPSAFSRRFKEIFGQLPKSFNKH